MSNNSKYLVCVNDKPHSQTALRYACAKAKLTGSGIVMLYVLNPVEHNTLFSVADVMKEEEKQEARRLLDKMSSEAFAISDIRPEGKVVEGTTSEVIINEIAGNKEISMLILGAASDGSSNKGRLYGALSGELGKKIHVPLLIVPGNLTHNQIEDLTKG